MQIDFVITELNVGGAERILTRLAIGLRKQGSEVRVFSLGALPEPPPSRRGADLLVHELREHQIEVSGGSGRQGQPVRSLTRLPSVFRKLRHWLGQRPDAICQSFLFHANVLSHLALKDQRWIAGVRVADPNSLRIAIEGHALRRADHVVCVSAATASFARKHYRLPEARASVIGNAVEADRFSKASPVDWRTLGWPADTNVVLFIGRLHEQKNLPLLQQTLDRFAPAGSNRKLVIVGEGPLGAMLRNWAEKLDGDRVRILPWQSDVAPLIAASRVLVLPSHYEGMPNVILEAMAGGKPVVCSRVQGSSELIGDDPLQGFDPDDASQLAARLNQFLAEPKLAVTIGLANQRRVREEFSVQQMVNSYRALYERWS